MFAKFQFLLVEAQKVVSPGVLNGGVEGRERLHKDFAFDVAAPGAPGHLGEELEGPFTRPEIGEVCRARVGVDDADERDVGKMEALGNHLGADEDVNFAGAEIAEDAAEIVLALQGVGIHALDAGFGK